MVSRPTFIDLFCGCGGFTLGIERAGFRCLAAVDSSPEATAVFKKNFPLIKLALEQDLTSFPPSQLGTLPGPKPIDLFDRMRPTCQGFSTVRQADGANSGERLVEDERRYLY